MPALPEGAASTPSIDEAGEWVPLSSTTSLPSNLSTVVRHQQSGPSSVTSSHDFPSHDATLSGGTEPLPRPYPSESQPRAMARASDTLAPDHSSIGDHSSLSVSRSTTPPPPILPPTVAPRLMSADSSASAFGECSLDGRLPSPGSSAPALSTHASQFSVVSAGAERPDDMGCTTHDVSRRQAVPGLRLQPDYSQTTARPVLSPSEQMHPRPRSHSMGGNWAEGRELALGWVGWGGAGVGRAGGSWAWWTFPQPTSHAPRPAARGPRPRPHGHVSSLVAVAP